MTAPTTVRTPPPIASFDRVGPRSWLGKRVVRLVRGRRTTPGRLRILRVVLVLVCLVSGGLGAYSALNRIDAVHDIETRSVPLSVDAAEIYQSLADADATAASGFLSGGLEPPAVRERYERDIAQAAGSLVRASREVGSASGAADSIAEINERLPVYTGLVETARFNHRQGFPVGGAYLRHASALMQDEILPAAEQLHQIASEQLDAQYQRAGAVLIPVLLLATILIALAIGQVVLFRKTKRVLNVGLVIATAAIVVVMLWWVGASVFAHRHLGNAQRHSTSATIVLGEAQIAALKARSNESLALVARDGGREQEANFTAQTEQLRQMLAQAPDFEGRAEAVTATQTWLTAHQQVRELEGSRMYPEAVAFATGNDPAGAGTAFNRLDRALERAVNAERREFDVALDRGSRAFAGLHIGTGLLTLLAAAAAAWGIGRRLEEYR